MNETIRRPPLPREWYKPSLIGTTGLLIYALALFTLPAALGRVIASTMELSILQWLCIFPCIIVAGYGLQLMGFVGHEGLHLSLHRRKMVSVILGLIYASAIPSYIEMGFSVHHWNHHRFTNQNSDPDVAPVKHLKTWWQRLLAARAIYNFLYFKTALRLAFGGDWPFAYQLPFKLETARKLCLLNFALELVWLSLYLAIAIYDPLTGLISIALPMVAVWFINSCQIFIDHAGTSDQPFQNSWSRTSPLMTLFYFGANYHLEHHLYPGVPCYRLPKVHQLLLESGIYEQVNAPIQASFWKSYLRLNDDYSAGMDTAFDPFQPELRQDSTDSSPDLVPN